MDPMGYDLHTDYGVFWLLWTEWNTFKCIERKLFQAKNKKTVGIDLSIFLNSSELFVSNHGISWNPT